MYRVPKFNRTQMRSVDCVEGETLEMKIERLIENKEPISDGSPEIFTNRTDGVISAYNIRTDRFEIACEAMDQVAGSIMAKRDGLPKEKELEEVKEKLKGDAMKDIVGEAKSAGGNEGENTPQ